MSKSYLGLYLLDLPHLLLLQVLPPALSRRRTLQLRRLIMIQRFVVAQASMSGFGGLDEVCFVGLVGGEGEGAELRVGPAGALEAGVVAPVFGEVVEEAAWGGLVSSASCAMVGGGMDAGEVVETDHESRARSPAPADSSTRSSHPSPSSRSPSPWEPTSSSCYSTPPSPDSDPRARPRLPASFRQVTTQCHRADRLSPATPAGREPACSSRAARARRRARRCTAFA